MRSAWETAHAATHRSPHIALGVLLWLACLLTACRSTNATWQRIEREGVLRVGLDPSYPPFENLVEGELVGLDIDLIRLVGSEMGVDVHFDVIGYDGLYDALLTGRVDVLASALIVDETRTKTFAYSEPYFNAGQVLVVRQGSLLRAAADFDGGIVAVELGAAGHVVATDWQHSAETTLQITTHETASAALQAVADGLADGAIIDAVSGRLGVAQLDTLTIANEAITVEPFAVVTRRADAELLLQLNRALKTIEEDGALRAVQQRWLDQPSAPPSQQDG